MYDYILLLDREIELFWNRKVTGASLLFLVNRYLPIMACIVRLSQFVHMSCSVSGDCLYDVRQVTHHIFAEVR